MEIARLTVGQMGANCYIVHEKGEAIIIDPGDDADYILNVMRDLDVMPTMIIATHGHFDHLMAAMELKLAFNIPFAINKNDEFLLKRMRETTKHYLGYDPGPAPIPDLYLKDGKLKTKNIKASIIETPGHTPGSISLHLNEFGALLVGDLLFADGTEGETSHTYSSQKDLDTSINEILKYPDDTYIYSGHGEGGTIEKVREARKSQSQIY